MNNELESYWKRTGHSEDDDIASLFKDMGIPVEAAMCLTDPQGKYGFSGLVELAEFVNTRKPLPTGPRVS